MFLPELRFLQPTLRRVSQQPLSLLAHEGKAQTVQVRLPDDAIDGIDQGLILTHRAFDLLLNFSPAGMFFGVIERSSNRRHQPRQSILEHVIGRPGL